MKSLFAWWYNVSLPKYMPDRTPTERERIRYARLTSMFLLVISPLSLLTTVYGVLTSINRMAPYIEVAAFGCVIASLIFNKLGFNIVAASLLLMSTMINVVGNLLTNPLDPVYVGIFSALVITVVLAGSLMPPVAALVTAVVNSLLIVLITIFQPHTAEYNRWVQLGYGSIMIALPIAVQIIIGIVTYVIMAHLISTIRRADRAEEIIALQKEITEHQRLRVQAQQQLEEGIAVIAQVHTAVANGNLEARVPLEQDNVLWQVAVPLNNLLSRVQYWKWNSDQLEKMQLTMKNVAWELQKARIKQVPIIFQKATGTQLDPLLLEMNHLSEQAFKTPPFPHSW